jgi:hypothetical protein
MTTAHWFTDCERGGFPVEKAVVGGCDLTVAFIGGGWQWLVRCQGRVVVEGAARSAEGAKEQAESVARSFLDVPRAA